MSFPSLEAAMQSNGLKIKTRFNEKKGMFEVQFTYPTLELVLGEGGTMNDALEHAWDNLAIQLDNCSNKRVGTGFDRVVETYKQDTIRTKKRRIEKEPLRLYT